MTHAGRRTAGTTCEANQRTRGPARRGALGVAEPLLEAARSAAEIPAAVAAAAANRSSVEK